MATACIPQVTFEFYEKLNPVVARFDKAQASTDGCAVLLKALDERLRLTDRLAACCGNGSWAWPASNWPCGSRGPCADRLYTCPSLPRGVPAWRRVAVAVGATPG